MNLLFHTCERCEVTFSKYSSFREHLDKVHADNRCDKCGKGLSSALAVKEHCIQSRDHFYCQICDSFEDDDWSLQEHIAINHFPCEEHDKIFESQHAYNQHCIQSGDHYFCTICDTPLEEREDFFTHGDQKHSLCRQCERIFPTVKALKEHNKGAHENRYCCDCDRRFETLSNLREHLNSKAHLERMIRCPARGCFHSFIKPSGLLQHAESGACAGGVTVERANEHIRRQEAVKAGKKATEGASKVSIPTAPEGYWVTDLSWNKRGFECCICGREFLQLSSLNQHLHSIVHEEASYLCENKHCRRKFPELKALAHHFEQDTCGVRKQRLTSLINAARGMSL